LYKLKINFKEIFMNQVNGLYRPYYYPEGHPRAGRFSGHGLSPTGLGAYLSFMTKRHPQLLSNLEPLIDADPNCTPEFDDQFFEHAYSVLRNTDGRLLLPVYRQNHTVGLIKEDDQFLLLDSYNAYGAKDADHIPLLRFLRSSFRDASITTLHDKMQNDYHNCAFFAVHNLLKVEREISNQQISLPQFIERIDTRKLHTPVIGCINDTKKMQSYRELGIHSIATPACLVPHIQSLKQATATAENSTEFRLTRVYLPYGTHENELRKYTVMGEHKGRHVHMNTNIQSANDEFRSTL